MNAHSPAFSNPIGTGIRQTPLHIAIKWQKQEIVKFLLFDCEDIDINATDYIGQTPLHYACQKRNPEAVKWLLGKGACVNARAANGMTPLHFACAKHPVLISEVESDRKAVLKLLLDSAKENKINVHEMDIHGVKPLDLCYLRDDYITASAILFISKE